jgi:hypothetical protein
VGKWGADLHSSVRSQPPELHDSGRVALRLRRATSPPPSSLLQYLLPILSFHKEHIHYNINGEKDSSGVYGGCTIMHSSLSHFALSPLFLKSPFSKGGVRRPAGSKTCRVEDPQDRGICQLTNSLPSSYVERDSL